MSKAVLFSMKPEYATAILDKSKKYEYRSSPPVSIETPYKGFIYASSPIRKVVGEANVPKTIEGEVEELIRKTEPNDPDSVRDYFGNRNSGAAIRMKDPIPYIIPRPLNRSAPQNFAYVDEDFMDNIKT